MILHWFSFLNPDLSLSLGTTPGLHDRVPSLDFGSGGRVGLEVPTRAGHVLNERGLPRGRQLFHNDIVCRGIFTDVVDPRMPLGRHLGGVEVVLRVVDPSMSARNLLLGVQLLKVSVAELVSANKPPILGITNVGQLPEPLLKSNKSEKIGRAHV